MEWERALKERSSNFSVAVERGILPPMPNVDKYPPGAFCGIGLATTDQNAAKNFDSELFGWNVNDFPMSPNDFYTEPVQCHESSEVPLAPSRW
jgi:hypothetical protein